MPLKAFEVWGKIMYACTIGMCYATLSPITLLFALAYLCEAYVLYGRNLARHRRTSAACSL